jgi:hypothetical protein
MARFGATTTTSESIYPNGIYSLRSEDTDGMKKEGFSVYLISPN